MAMIKCKECGKEISNKAEACPSCGAKPYKPSGCLVVFLAVVLIGIFGSIASSCNPPPPPPAKTPEQIAAEQKASAARAKVIMSMQVVKDAMREPESIVWESVRANGDASLICVAYRARNGFGGMTADNITIIDSKVKRDAASWNKHCTAPLTDHTILKHTLR